MSFVLNSVVAVVDKSVPIPKTLLVTDAGSHVQHENFLKRSTLSMHYNYLGLLIFFYDAKFLTARKFV